MKLPADKLNAVADAVDGLSKRFDRHLTARKDSDFDESKHPRAADGKFGRGGDSKNGAQKEKISISALKEKLEGMSAEKLMNSLKNESVGEEIKKYIEKELDSRANRGTSKGFRE